MYLGPLGPWAALIGYGAGIGALAQAFLVAPDTAQAYAWFWLGHALCFLSCLAFGLRGGSAGRHALALAGLACALYLPILLRGADRPHFNDELFQIEVLEMMRDLGTTRMPVTAYPLPGDYPGLQFVGLALSAATGLPLTATVRLVIVILHALIPIAAYMALSAALERPNYAFVGALVYVANTSYYFVHSLFSYETMGILLFLLVVGFAVQIARVEGRSPIGFSAGLLLSITALIMTHHFSGMMAIAVLLSFSLGAGLTRHSSAPRFRNLLLFSMVVWLAWLVEQTAYSVRYLWGTSERRATLLLETARRIIWPESAVEPLRPLFLNSPLPLWERAYSFSYPILVLALIVIGGWAVLRMVREGRRRGAAPPITWLALGAVGPLTWLLSAPGILTGSSDAIFRSWPFFFLGIALYGAFGLPEALPRLGLPAPAVLPAAGLLAGALLAGGIIIGDNQAGRFRSTVPAAAAGATAITADLLEASEWLRASAGPFHRLAGDRASQVAFGTVGRQVTKIWGVWQLYFEADAVRSAALADSLALDYIVVDWRVTRLPPRSHGLYYGVGEPAVGTVPAAGLAKFELMPGLDRVYDNGDIVIYSRRAQPATGRAAPGATR